MKTIEDIEKTIKDSLVNDCYAVTLDKRTFVADKLKDEESDIYAAKKALDEAKAYYDMCVNDYLLRTSIGSDQKAIFLSALRSYVRETGEVAFAEWLNTNHKCDFEDVFADTPSRVWTRIMSLHDEYVKYRRQEANDAKAKSAKAKADAKASIANLRAAGLSLDDIIALAKEQAE